MLTKLNLVSGKLEEALTSSTSFGQVFLDKALTGFLNTDLVLLGARSGKGKTQALLDSAAFNAASGKKVLFIALEAEEAEMEMRLLYKLEVNLYFKAIANNKAYKRAPVDVNYRNWRLGLLKEFFEEFHDEAVRIFVDRYFNITTHYKKHSFSFDDLALLIDESSWADVIYIDHLHYFDLLGAKPETQETGQLIKKIRQLNLQKSKPVVMAAHVRKSERLVPDLDDFMGTSDIHKNATVCVMMAPDYSTYDAQTAVVKTYFSVPKARTGSLGNLVGVCYYSTKHAGYLPKFDLGLLNFKGDKVEPLEKDKYPEWAREFKEAF